jgi:hypothetical protein
MGTLAPAQQAYLQRLGDWSALGGIALVMFIGGFFVLPFALDGDFEVAFVAGSCVTVILMAIVGWHAWQWWRRQQVLQALTLGQIQAGEGRGVWRKNKYVPVVNEQTLNSISNDSAIWSGVFRFYYEPQTRTLLSYEVLNRVDKTELQNALQQTLKFSLEDVSYNRNGQITEAQRRQLMTNLLWESVVALGLMGIFALALLGGIGAFIEELSSDEAVIIPLLILGGLVVLLGIGVLSYLRRAFQRWRDAQSGTAVRIEGHASSVRRVTGSGKNRTVRYYFVFDSGVEFQVSAAPYTALLNHEQYRLYYTPQSKQILSIEVV